MEYIEGIRYLILDSAEIKNINDICGYNRLLDKVVEVDTT